MKVSLVSTVCTDNSSDLQHKTSAICAWKKGFNVSPCHGNTNLANHMNFDLMCHYS